VIGFAHYIYRSS